MPPLLLDPTDPYLAALERVEQRLMGRAGPRPLVEYQRRPVDFAVEVLGIPEHTIRWSLNPGYENHRWDGTPDPLVVALDALAAWKDVGVEAGTGTGKTYVLGAAGMLWFLGCFEGAIVITVAPKEDQLTLNLWKEVRKLWPAFKRRFPTAELTSLKIRMRGGIDDSWAGFGFVAGVGADEESANRARGFHAEHMLVIFEETPGIDPAIMTAFEHTCTAPHNLRLALGNPDNQHDELHRFCTSPGVVHVRISALDHPNVVTGNAALIPGAASRESIERRARKYGPDSPLYNAMVRGISPPQARDALIRWEWLEAAAARYSDPELRKGPKALGVDVANSQAGDEAAISRWLGACCLEVSAFPCPDANRLGFQVAVEIELQRIDPQHVGVDSVGVGAGTVNELKRLHCYVQALNGGASPEFELEGEEDGAGRAVLDETRFANLRAQMWWQAREDLQHGRIAIPRDEELWRDLTTPRWWTRNGKIYVEPKEEIIKRLGRSPNKGDAFVYGNWVRQRGKLPEPETEIRPFDPAILAYEADECRRVRTRRPADVVALHPEFGVL